jgi:hypothetical protein
VAHLDHRLRGSRRATTKSVSDSEHIYAAIVGVTVSVVQLTVSGAPSQHPAIDTDNDAAVLTVLTAHLGS